MPGGRRHRTSTRSWIATWNNCGTISALAAVVRSNLVKEMELLFAEADALRQELADRRMSYAEMQQVAVHDSPSKARR